MQNRVTYVIHLPEMKEKKRKGNKGSEKGGGERKSNSKREKREVIVMIWAEKRSFLCKMK